MKVFWSWQSDLPPAVTRTVIKKSLQAALDTLSTELDLDPAERPELDHDTKGAAGAVGIADTIFKKIDGATLFVADVTPIGEAPSLVAGKALKKLPNPNVLIELGYALKALGEGAVILVSNEALGGAPENLPFDLRGRRSVIFNLPTSASVGDIAKAEKRLTSDLAGAIETNVQAHLEKRDSGVVHAATPSAPGDRSLWVPVGEPFKVGEYFQDGPSRELRIVGNTRMYLRVMPAGWKSEKPSRATLQEHKPLSHYGTYSGGDGGSTKVGYLSYGVKSSHDSETRSGTQWIAETGEWWAFNGTIEAATLPTTSIISIWAQMLNDVVEFLDRYGGKAPFRFEIGIVGLSGNWPGEISSKGPEPLESGFYLERRTRLLDPAFKLKFVTDAVNRLRDCYAIKPVDESMVDELTGLGKARP